MTRTTTLLGAPIITVSLGAARILKLEGSREIEIEVQPGSLYILGAETNKKIHTLHFKDQGAGRASHIHCVSCVEQNCPCEYSEAKGSNEDND
jgi:alkylated DNA repair dioxygenase AlkB